MMTCFEGSFSPKPQAILLNEVYNIGDWLSTALDSIEKHSGPHCYKITREENGKAALQYKSWSTDKVGMLYGYINIIGIIHVFSCINI